MDTPCSGGDSTPAQAKGNGRVTTEVDGRTIFWPAAFSNATRDVLAEFLPEVIASKGPPRAISKEKWRDLAHGLG
jgi:hypothetical protein